MIGFATGYMDFYLGETYQFSLYFRAEGFLNLYLKCTSGLRGWDSGRDMPEVFIPGYCLEEEDER